jgi:hypothetical protein
MRGRAGFFDVDDRLKRLSDLGDQLEAFRAAVDFEAFRPALNAALAYSDGAQGGRPPFDPVMMFKRPIISPTSALNSSSTTGFHSCVFWGWGYPTVRPTPARFGCSERN